MLHQKPEKKPSRFPRLTILFFLVTTPVALGEWPDIRSVPPDLITPAMSTQPAAPGLRVKQQLPAWQQTNVYHVLYLPGDWKSGSKWPVIVEFGGNGGYKNKFGDTSHGRPENGNLGYGLSAGNGYIWLCLPYLNEAGDDITTTWWGNPPEYNPQPTFLVYDAALAFVCREFRGDPSRVILCGFSRGALACNYLGLHDEETSKLWSGFFAFSHYDGLRQWPYPGDEPDAAALRLDRLGNRPQFLCAEGDDVDATIRYWKNRAPHPHISFAKTGFANHNDEWILRPSPARTLAREWLAKVPPKP